MYSTIATCLTPPCPKSHPKKLWRFRTATEFSQADVSAVRFGLQHTSLKDERWAFAREGHPADAISMMIGEWPVGRISHRVDAIMTAIVLAALMGSAASTLVAYHTIAQLAFRRPRLREIAASWLVVVEEQERRRFWHPTASDVIPRSSDDVRSPFPGRSYA